MDNKRKLVETIDREGNSLKLAVIKPTNKITQESSMVYHLKMSELIRSGSRNNSQRLLLRAELEEYLLKTGVWTMNDALEVEKLALEIRAHELVLKKGGISLSDGRTIALEMAEKRQMILEKHTKRQQFDSITIESYAENFRFEFLIIKCLVFYDSGKSYLVNHAEYMDRQDEQAVMDGARELASIIYGLEKSINDTMFEMRWLKEAGMIDERGRYVSKDGSYIDRDGHRVNKDGRYINSGGEMVDTLGRLVDENGNLLVDTAIPFIDDETGDQVVICGIGQKAKKSKKDVVKKKRTRKKTTK